MLTHAETFENLLSVTVDDFNDPKVAAQQVEECIQAFTDALCVFVAGVYVDKQPAMETATLFVVFTDFSIVKMVSQNRSIQDREACMTTLQKYGNFEQFEDFSKEFDQLLDEAASAQKQAILYEHPGMVQTLEAMEKNEVICH